MLKYKICVIMSDIRNVDTLTYMLGIEKAANALGFSLVTFSMLQLCESITAGEDKVFDLINFDNYDGVIVLAHSFAPHIDIRDKLGKLLKEKCSVPVVTIGAMEDFDRPRSRNSEGQVELAYDHLIEEHGCKHIYMLGGTKNTNASRIRGAKKSCEKHGLVFDENDVLYGGYWTDCAERLANNIATEAVPVPDAVVCINEPIARAFIKHMFQYNYRVPDDIRVICISSSPEKLGNILSISTVIMDGEIMGYDAMAMLYNMMTGQEAPEKRTPQPVLTAGISCGCSIKPQRNTRFKFEQRDKEEHRDMLFRNSNLEEKLYTAKNLSEVISVIGRNYYLVPDKKCLSISLLEKDNIHANCIFFVEDQSERGSYKTFVASDIYPDGIVTLENNDITTYTFVLPLVFDGKMIGFMTLMYDSPSVYDEIALKFAHKIAISVERLCQLEEARRIAIAQSIPVNRNNAEEEIDDSPSDMQDTSTSKDISIFANKDGIMCKVVVENILYFEAVNRKICIALKSGKYEIKQRLFEIEEQLRAKGFLRISKSMILNVKKVLKFRPGPDRTIIVTLTNNDEVKVSRMYTEDFRESVSI